MSAANVEDLYPLSPVQRGMVYHSLLAPDSGVYTLTTVCTVRGALDVDVFRAAWQILVDRHPVLRTGLTATGAEALRDSLQVVYRRMRVPLEVQDWRDLDPAEQARRLDAYLEDERRRGFDLARPPLMRLALFRTADDCHTFVRVHHHLMLDGWSSPMLYRELFDAYAALVRQEQPSLPSRRPYRDYIAWLQRQDVAAAEDYWRRTLTGFRSATPLPNDRGAPHGNSARVESGDHHLTVSEEATGALQRVARRSRLTLNTVVAGAWALLLSRYSGEHDVVFGTVVSGRPADLPGVEQMIGLFINTLPVRIEVQPEMPAVNWLATVQEQTLTLDQYQHSPLAQVQEWSGVPRGQPLFESVVIFENYPLDGSLLASSRDLTVEVVRGIERSSFPLTIYALPGRSLHLRLVYDPTRFSAASITRLGEQLRLILEGIAADPDRRVGELPLLTPEQGRVQLVDWNATQVDYSLDRTLTLLFEERADRQPDATALISGERQVTYSELDRRASQLAHHLRGLGVTPGNVVAVCVERSPDLVVALLAVLKAGAAYLPLDPAYPPERLRFMLQDSRAPALLTTSSMLDRLPDFAGQTVRLDRDSAAINAQPVARLAPLATGDDVACLLYTSGSTGEPKGVENTHRSLVNTLYWQWDAFPYADGEVACQKTALSFGDSIQELFAPLVAGVPTVLVPETALTDPSRFVGLLAEHGVTRLLLVPSLLRVLLDRGGELARELPRLRLWITSGEALPVDVARRFQRAYPEARLVNLYGQSEAAYDATAHVVDDLDEAAMTVPIGRPIANVEVYVLDRHLHPAPIGAVGEIWVGGAGLARGYWNRPDLTAERFFPHPFRDEPGARLLRTGDLGRFRDDGVLEYVGRFDEQVKVRGVRVELGEIEQRLRAHPGIADVAVTAWEDRTDDPRLVAYVVPAPGHAVPALRDLRAFLKQTLPAAMVPAIYVPLLALPRTPNGKLDRQALPPPTSDRPELNEPYVAPRNSTEETLAAIWREVLRVDCVGVDDNFFDLGGASFEVLEAVARAGEEGLQLSPELLFVYPTIAELAEFTVPVA